MPYNFPQPLCHRWWLAGLLALLTLVTGCGGGSSPPPPLTITAQPSDPSVVAGSVATLSVVANRSDVSYQWQISTDGGTAWSNVAGGTQASYATLPTTLADSGTRYRVIVGAGGASVISSAVTLTVSATVVAPVITVAPASLTVTAPASAVFSVTATGTALTYQWQRSADGGAHWVDLGGATAATFDTGATTVAPIGDRFRVVVANAAGSVTSAAATLSVQPAPAAPAFTTQPTGQSVIAGSAAAFTVAVAGTPTPTLQWQRSTDDGASFSDIAGATGATFDTGPTTLSQNAERYRAVAGNDAGSAISNAVLLTVNAASQAPSITTNPTSQTVTAPNPATFSAAASGVPTPTWQWQLSTDGGATFANIAGATSASYTTPATVAGDNGRRFRAVASNAAGTVNSNAAALSVVAPTPLTIDTPLSLPVAAVNAAYTTSMAASGGTPPYRWSNLSAPPVSLSLDASTGVISGIAPAQAGIYSWMIQVQDSANPPQSSQEFVQLTVEAPCDHGFGSLTVDGAPPTVERRLCPQQAVPPGPANADGNVGATWLEQKPGVFLGVGVQFQFGTGRLMSVTFNLNDPTRSWSYSCTVPAAEPSYPACTGVSVDPIAGTVTFLNTVVRSGAVQPFTLNGMLKY